MNGGGGTLVKHVVICEQKIRRKAYFIHASSWSARTAFRIAISCNFGEKGILFSSTSRHLGYEFQRHESSLYSPAFSGFCDCLMSHNLDLLDIVVFLIRMVHLSLATVFFFFDVGNSFWKTGQCLGSLFSHDMQKGHVFVVGQWNG